MSDAEQKPELQWFVGIDWATQEHEVCVVDREGKKVGGRSFKHTGEGLATLCSWIAEVTSSAIAVQVAVVVELVRGALVATLLERGYRVFECNPKQTDRLRDRHSVAGAKDDRLDAFVLAEAGRKDLSLLREVPADAEAMVQIRELARMHDELVHDHVRLTNRLREQLHRYYPQMLELGSDVSERWRLELWERAPTPDAALELRPAWVRALLARHRIRRIDAKEVITTLRTRKLHVAPGVTEAAVMHIETLVPQLRVLRDQIHATERKLDAALNAFAATEESSVGQSDEQRDVAILRELPGAGKVVIAALLAEAWPALRARDYHQLRALSGVAPITQQTGKQGKRKGPRPLVMMRRACNARLRDALWHWAASAAQHYERWQRELAALHARGIERPQALRIIGDRLLRITCACLRDGTHYKHVSETNQEQSHAAQAA
ncbi:MAG: IS110 family transposase [Planctomycetaceae bacterium]|nr:IS110 family transposase [Planctomycetaceae bacterium]